MKLEWIFDGARHESPLLSDGTWPGQDSLALAGRPPGGDRPNFCPAERGPSALFGIDQQYFDFVWSSARHLGVGASAIDDVVQEVFIVIHGKLHSLQHPNLCGAGSTVSRVAR